jgi:glycosyltransferase involved in cell wall biosynthesis
MSITETKYSIVVPFFNEEGSVRTLYTKIVEAMDAVGEPYEMIFVNDGSRDRTGTILAEIAENDDRVVAVMLRRNFGQTPALKAGFDFARGDIIISMDGDLQHDPAEIPVFLEKIADGYDIVSGWRYERVDGRFTRRIPSRVANWLMAKLSRVDLHDFGTTFKAYQSDTIKDLPLYGEMHRFIPALASWSGATIAEVPIKNIPRQSGRSNYNLSRTFRVVFDLIIIKFLLDFSTKPLHFFGRIGLLGVATGTLTAFVLVAKKLLYGTDVMVEHGPLTLMAILFIVTGIQLFSIGLIGELVARTYYETQRKPVYAVREVRRRRRSSLEYENV